MNESFRLFVYGQLRRGQIGHQRLGLEQRMDWLGPARIHGRLHDFGDYPGLILGGEDIVHGEVLAFDDPALGPSSTTMKSAIRRTRVVGISQARGRSARWQPGMGLCL